MVRQNSVKAQELDVLLFEAVKGVENGIYKSSYAAAKALKLNPRTVLNRVKGGLSRKEARQEQQLLSKN